MGKIKVLASIEWFTPAFQAGGIISSLANQVEHLSPELEFWVVTSNRDLLAPLKEIPQTDVWLDKGTHHIQYCSQNPIWTNLLNDIQPQFIYINGLFNGPFCRSLLRFGNKSIIPIVLASHGMLAPSALAIKWWLKKPWLLLNRALGRFHKVQWHASSSKEATQIAKWFPTASIKIAQNLPPAPAKSPESPLVKLQFLSVGRIHPIKNYGFVAECLAEFAEKLHQPVKYHLIGPVEDENEKDRIISHSNAFLNIKFLGEQNPQELPRHYQNATCLLVPSLTENFGVVVAEALGNGLPVVVSDQTPWGTFPASPALSCLPLNKKSWIDVLEHLTQSNLREDLIPVAQSYFEHHLLKEDIRQQHIALFQ